MMRERQSGKNKTFGQSKSKEKGQCEWGVSTDDDPIPRRNMGRGTKKLEGARRARRKKSQYLGKGKERYAEGGSIKKVPVPVSRRTQGEGRGHSQRLYPKTQRKKRNLPHKKGGRGFQRRRR